MSRRTLTSNYIKKEAGKLAGLNLALVPLSPDIDISIIAPAYNEERCIERFLTKLDEQVYRNFEVIVVDNNSTDETLQKALSLKNKLGYPLHVILEKEQGVANARKKGSDYVIIRFDKFKRKVRFPYHIFVNTDVDVLPPKGWLKNIKSGFLSKEVGALAGTHGASPEIDKIIERNLRIKDYFNVVPKLMEYLADNKIGVLKMSGPNSAFEIEAYCSTGGMRQEYDSISKRVKLNETNSVAKRIIKKGYKILPMGVRVVTNKRRQLYEIVKNYDSYFPPGYKGLRRFYVVRDDEKTLLKKALDTISKKRWIEYRSNIITKVLNNFINLEYE